MRCTMTLGWLVLLVLIGFVFWLFSRAKKHEERIQNLERRSEEAYAEEE